MKSWTWLLVTALLAGCADGGAEKADGVKLGDGTEVDLEDATPDSGLGSITGIVLTQGIQPIANASLTLAPATATVRSGPQGTFVFANLEPGLYTVTAKAPSYNTTIATADVAADSVTEIRMVLSYNPAPQPRHETFPFKGFEQAGNGLASFLVDIVQDIAGVDYIHTCTCVFDVNASEEVKTFVIEAIWEDSVEDPVSATQYYWQLNSPEIGTYEDDYFASPGLVHIPGDKFAAFRDFTVAIYTDEDWITVDQEFEVFVTLFYVEPAPAGWSVYGGDS